MIENLKEGPEEFKDYDSELLLKILNKTSLENEKGDDKELFVDENWKINSKNMSNIICLLYTSPSPRDNRVSRMPSSA